jgi:ABC-type lipoprotein export system ATPase subunit
VATMQARGAPILRRNRPAESDTMTADRAPILEPRAIYKSFGRVRTLRSVDFTLMPGEAMALAGDNGAEKYTLIKIITGAHQPDSGGIRLEGQPVHFSNPRAATGLGIATVYQDLALVDQRSVAANLFLGNEPTRGPFVDRRRMPREAEQVLTRLRIRVPSIHALVGGLSSGQRQAVAIGRTLAQRSRVVIPRWDLSEILLLRGFMVSHEAIRDWEAKLLPIGGDALRKRRHGTRRGPGVRVASDIWAASRILTWQDASAESMTNFTIFSMPGPITINLFQRRSAAIACHATPPLRSMARA